MFEKLAFDARKMVIGLANDREGAHLGGIFSCIDFLLHFYNRQFTLASNKGKYYSGLEPHNINLIFSKAHCYLAQLVTLDILAGQTLYSEIYLKTNSGFFGHPKRDVSNIHLQVSAGSLGQAVAFANGVALASKISNMSEIPLVLLGDGEFNEGVVHESLCFASQHQLPIVFVLDNNNQQSLGVTDKIHGNFDIYKRVAALGIEFLWVDGHDHSDLERACDLIFSRNSQKPPLFIELRTVKGKGVSFMEKNAKWHSRRFKGTEYSAALADLASGYESQ